VLAAYQATVSREGSLLVLVPTEAWAQRLRGRLEQRGLAVAEGEQAWDRMRATWPVIVGARGAAFAPTTRLAGAVVIDADDEGFRSESSPTWRALDVVAERCRRDGAPLWVTAVLPSPTTVATGVLHLERSNMSLWPSIDVVDRRSRDPREGVLSEPALQAAHHALAGPHEVAVAVILQRLGAGRLFACRRCGELARCAICGQAEIEQGERFSCPDEHQPREAFCLACGATNLRKVRSGVSTLARDISLQLRQDVTEITAATAPGLTNRVVVGTEAVFGRIRRCGLVIFVDFDQYLLAPRASARRQAIGAITKAGRLVGPRRDGRGAVLVQTRRDDDVISALRSCDVSPLRISDDEAAQVLGLAPYGASAEVSGEGAEAFLHSMQHTGLRVRELGEATVLSATSVQTLCDALATGTRGGGRLRIAVS
jgi:primosomal protein N'